MNIIYKMNEEKTHINIVKILYADNTQPKEKLRTKEWLLKISEFIEPSLGSMGGLSSSPSHLPGSTDQKPEEAQVEEEKKE